MDISGVNRSGAVAPASVPTAPVVQWPPVPSKSAVITLISVKFGPLSQVSANPYTFVGLVLLDRIVSNRFGRVF